MERYAKELLVIMLLLASPASAEMGFMVSPSVGSAGISNIDGYENSPFLRVDGGLYPIPQFGVNVFAVSYPGFKTSGAGTDVTIKINGYGVGLSGRWPAHPHMQPYARLEYMQWNAEASAFGQTFAKDNGGSAGLALGMEFPVKRFLGIKTELCGYNDVSGANIRQLLLAATFRF